MRARAETRPPDGEGNDTDADTSERSAGAAPLARRPRPDQRRARRVRTCADAADWSGMGELFTEDGQAVFASATFPGRHFGEAAGAVMAVFSGTHHLSTNHAIQIEGDRATARSYLQAIHLTDPDDNTQHHDVGGWYDNELVRTPDGWRFTRVELSFVWTGRRAVADGASRRRSVAHSR